MNGVNRVLRNAKLSRNILKTPFPWEFPKDYL
jgi:hypothetical protein